MKRVEAVINYFGRLQRTDGDAVIDEKEIIAQFKCGDRVVVMAAEEVDQIEDNARAEGYADEGKNWKRTMDAKVEKAADDREREIVAWLRDSAEAPLVDGLELASAFSAQIRKNIADAIERGEHRRKP